MSAPKETDPAAVFARVLNHADHLFEALTDLEAVGGLKALPIRPKSIEKARAALRSVRQAIDGQVGGFKPGKPPPRPDRPDRPAPARTTFALDLPADLVPVRIVGPLAGRRTGLAGSGAVGTRGPRGGRARKS